MPWLLIAAIAMLVVSLVITAMLLKRQTVKPAALDEWEFPQSDEGTPQPVVFGDVWLEGPMVMWFGNYRIIKIKSGGKK